MQRQLFISVMTIVCTLGTAQMSVSGSTGLTAPGTSSAPAGSLGGKVKFEGTLPKTLPISMRSDPSCAAEHPRPVHSQDVMSGQNGTLANVIVFVSQGVDEHAYDVPQTPALMEQKGCLYEPHVLAMRAGQTLRVVNADKTTHNIHPMPANNREWNKAQTPGQPIEEKFAREEVSIPVKCNIHPWMHSYIAIFKHPFFAVTGQDGRFELRNLPPGEYTIEAWHEKLGTMTQHVKIAEGDNKTVDFTFKPRG